MLRFNVSFLRGDLPPFSTKKRGFWSIQPTQEKDRVNLLFLFNLIYKITYFFNLLNRKKNGFRTASYGKPCLPLSAAGRNHFSFCSSGAHLIKSAGFSLVEVLGAMMILSIALVALMENQSSSLQLTKKALILDQATSLAQAKMAELTVEANRRSLAEFPDNGKGEFEDDDLQRFSWRYNTQPVAAPDFAAMAQAAVGEDGDNADQGNAGLLDGPLKNITDAWSKALLELRVEIVWKEGNTEKSYAVVTHLVDQQAGANINSMVQGISQAVGGAQGNSSGEGESQQ